MKKVLLAIGNDKFNNLLRSPLSENFNVLSVEVYSRKYLEEFIEDHDPDIIIVHDRFLTSENDDEFEQEVEWLQIIERIRQQYDDQKRIVFICERNSGDPFLSELVNRNILDIFHSRSIDITGIIEQLRDQPRYSKVSYLKVDDSGNRYKSVGNSLFDFRTEEEIAQSEIIEQVNNLQEEAPIPKEEIVTPKKFNIPKITLPNFKNIGKRTTEEVEINEEEDVPTITRRTSIKGAKIKPEPEPKAQYPREQNDIFGEEESTPKRKSRFNIFGNTGGGNGFANKKNGNEDYHLGTFRPRLIAVGSLHPGAGSTFFLYNFTRYLSDYGVPSAVLEGLNDIDALFALVGSESPPKFDWESIHNLVLNNENSRYLFSIPKWNVERTVFIPTLEVPIHEFKSHHAKEMVYFARQSPIVFVDISHDWTNPIAQEAIAHCDELWCITEPNPMYLEIQRKHHQTIFQVSSRVSEDNVIVIGNKWGSGVDVSRFPEMYARIPYIPENIKAMSNNTPAYRVKPKAFTEFSRLYEKLIMD